MISNAVAIIIAVTTIGSGDEALLLLSSTQRHYLKQQERFKAHQQKQGQQEQQNSRSSSPSSLDGYETKFVFIIGLEGTGHHFVSNIVSESPTYKYLKDIIHIHPRLTRQLMSTLYQSGPFPNKGLISGTCPIASTSMSSKTSAVGMIGGRGSGGIGGMQLNLATMMLLMLSTRTDHIITMIGNKQWDQY